MAIKNKRGQIASNQTLGAIIVLAAFVFIYFFYVIFAGVSVLTISKFDSAMSSIDIEIGETSFNATYNKTMFQAFETMQDSADNNGIIFLFGMIIIQVGMGLVIKSPRLMIIFDIFFIVVCFFLASFLAVSFNDYLGVDTDINDIHADFLPKTSTFLLNLPFIVAITGVLTSIATYVLRKRREQQFFG